MDAGDLVPDELHKCLLMRVNKHPDTNGILFDGYPRTIAQAEALDAFLVSIKSSVAAIVHLKRRRNFGSTLIKRGKTSGRIDDQDEEKIRNRYKNTTKKAPLMDYYKNQNKCCKTEWFYYRNYRTVQ
jgi:adenylate kinase